MFELQAGGERSVGDLQLLGGRLFGGEAVLELVARLGEGAREAVVRMPHHPAEELGRDTQGPDLRGEPRRPAKVLGRAGGEGPADRRADQQWPDDVRAAALVLLGPLL